METRVCRLYGQKDLRVETEKVATPIKEQVLAQVKFGGICGSDLSYYHHGGIGNIQVREPIILGHEFSGVVEAIGPDVSGLLPGDKIAINPSKPCGTCSFCKKGIHQHCISMRFCGSAMYQPHEQGGFRDRMIIEAKQCEKISSNISLSAVACAEPLSVCLHGLNRAGDVRDKRVLVAGAGPIGSLCVGALLHGGAKEIIAFDIHETPLNIAKKMGANQVFNVATHPEALQPYQENKGYFDLTFECSAAKSAIAMALLATKPQGKMVQLGVAGNIEFPLSLLVSKEIELIGSHRFHCEFANAVQLIDAGVLDVTPIVTMIVSANQANDAMLIAGDRSKNVKVQLSFSA